MANDLPLLPFIEYKLRLKGDMVPGMQKPPTLGVDVRKNNVSITAWTGGKDGEGRNANIRAGLDAFTFSAVCVALQDCIDFKATAEKPAIRIPIRCYTPRKRQPGEQGLPKNLAATVLVGKDKDGQVYISVVQKNPPHVKFVFRPSEYHEVMDESGQQPMPMAQVSMLYARAWLKTFEPMVAYALNTQVDDWRSEQNGGGGNQGNNRGGYNNNQGGGGYNSNNGGGGGGGYNANSDGFDSDIPI